MNWGYRIIVAYVAFVAFIGYLVSQTFMTNHDLVQDDYYAAEIAYQNRIEEEKRTALLPEQLRWAVEDATVVFDFPKDFSPTQVDGEIVFFRPSDETLDRRFDIAVGEAHQQAISTQDLTPGFYQVRVHWNGNGLDYYNEGSVYVN